MILKCHWCGSRLWIKASSLWIECVSQNHQQPSYSGKHSFTWYEQNTWTALIFHLIFCETRCIHLKNSTARCCKKLLFTETVWGKWDLKWSFLSDSDQEHTAVNHTNKWFCNVLDCKSRSFTGEAKWHKIKSQN